MYTEAKILAEEAEGVSTSRSSLGDKGACVFGRGKHVWAEVIGIISRLNLAPKKQEEFVCAGMR